MTRDLRVLTWNIHGARDASVESIAGEISALGADVVCLNEVRRRDAKKFAALLDARAFVASSLFGPYGNVILTKREVTGRRRVRFPNTRRRDRRDAAVVMLGDLSICAVHLNLHKGRRAADIQHLMRELPERSIIAGDMNETSEGDVWRSLGRRYADACPEGAPTYPAADPRERIDVVWVPPGTRVVRCRVVASLSSDHCALAVDIVL